MATAAGKKHRRTPGLSDVLICHGEREDEFREQEHEEGD